MKATPTKAKVTDHFITIIGIEKDSKGRHCFRFFDNWTSGSEGYKKELLLIFVPNKGLVAAWTGKDGNSLYEEDWRISNIRRCRKK